MFSSLIDRASTQLNYEFSKFQSALANGRSPAYHLIPSYSTHRSALGRSDNDLRLPPIGEVQGRWIDNVLAYNREKSISQVERTGHQTVAQQQTATVNDSRVKLDAVLDLGGVKKSLDFYLASMVTIEGDGPRLTRPDGVPISRIIDERQCAYFERQEIDFMIQTNRLRKLEIIQYLRPAELTDRAWSEHLNSPNTLRRLNQELSRLCYDSVNIRVLYPESNSFGPLLIHYHQLYDQLIAHRQPHQRLLDSVMLDKIDHYVKGVFKGQGRQQIPSIQSYMILIKTLQGDLMSQGLLVEPYDPPLDKILNNLKAWDTSLFDKIAIIPMAMSLKEALEENPLSSCWTT